MAIRKLARLVNPTVYIYNLNVFCHSAFCWTGANTSNFVQMIHMLFAQFEIIVKYVSS